MLVQEKPGLGVYTHAESSLVLVFWRELDPSNPEDWLIISEHHRKQFASRVDCLVGRLLEKGDFLVNSHESWRLEPYTGRTE